MMFSSSLSKAAACSSGGIVNWAYEDVAERFRIRDEARATGSWPPATCGMFIKQENMLVAGPRPHRAIAGLRIALSP